MKVKKSILEAKTDQELEEYLKEGNRYVPKACTYAFEILKSRGKTFTTEETLRINLLISKKYISEQVIIQPYHKKAAKYIYISAIFGLINLLLSYELFNNRSILAGVITLLLILAIGFLISKGSESAKYIFIILMIFGLIGLPVVLMNFKNNIAVAIISIIQIITQIYALVLLFKIPNTK